MSQVYKSFTNLQGKTLAIVVPCYNEDAILPYTIKSLSSLMRELKTAGVIAEDSYILFVNDGSNDGTWDIIAQAHQQDSFVCGVDLSNNVGHQKALLAGLDFVATKCGMAITIDADLQDDISVIEDMVLKYEQGNDIVYGVRRERKTDTWFKRNTALLFYTTMEKLGVSTVYNHADFRLMSSKAISFLLGYKEQNLFLRGLVPLVGLRNDFVYYNRKSRTAGDSKYPLKKMLAFAMDGVTSFSVKPVHFILFMGLIFVVIAFFILAWVLYQKMIGNVVQGWTSLIVSVWFVGGVLLFAIGIIGEYIGKIYIEVKHRPRWHVSEVLFK